MWSRIRDWLSSIGRPQFDRALDEALETNEVDDRYKRRVERELNNLDRELAAIIANMQHTSERFDDR